MSTHRNVHCSGGCSKLKKGVTTTTTMSSSLSPRSRRRRVGARLTPLIILPIVAIAGYYFFTMIHVAKLRSTEPAVVSSSNRHQTLSKGAVPPAVFERGRQHEVRDTSQEATGDKLQETPSVIRLCEPCRAVSMGSCITMIKRYAHIGNVSLETAQKLVSSEMERCSACDPDTCGSETITTADWFPSTLYHTCADQPFPDLMLEIYPELRGLPTQPIHQNSLPTVMTSRDFVFFEFEGRCTKDFGEHKLTLEWLRRHFPGTTVILNGEPYRFKSWQRGFHLGYGNANNVTSMLVYFCSISLLRYPLEVQKRILDPTQKAVSTKERFLIYISRNCVEFREVAFHRLSQIDTVYHGSSCSGLANLTVSIPEEDRPGIDWNRNYEIVQQYRFCLTMENADEKGYITEKILNGFAGGCVPIFYGTTGIFSVFNHKAFIFYDIDDPEHAIDRVKYLNQNETAYEEVMAEPILANGNRTIEEFFSLADEIGGGALKNRIRNMIDMGRMEYAS